MGKKARAAGGNSNLPRFVVLLLSGVLLFVYLHTFTNFQVSSVSPGQYYQYLMSWGSEAEAPRSNLPSGKFYNSTWARDITFGIKTTGRIQLVNDQIDSIRKWFPEAVILVANDMEPRFNESNKRANVTYLELPKDVGLSAGRNYLVSQTKTKYYFTCDDDFVFTYTFRLQAAYDILETHPDVGIVGGALDSFVNEYLGMFQINLLNEKGNVTESFNNPLDFPITPLEAQRIRDSPKEVRICRKRAVFEENFEWKYGCIRTQRVYNMFLARTDLLKANPWDEELKLTEHVAFFYDLWLNAPQVKIVACNKIVHVRHNPNKRQLSTNSYMSKRGRTPWYVKIFFERAHIVNYYEDTCQLPLPRPVGVDFQDASPN